MYIQILDFFVRTGRSGCTNSKGEFGPPQNFSDVWREFAIHLQHCIATEQGVIAK